jgi:hypothetical protein
MKQRHKGAQERAKQSVWMGQPVEAGEISPPARVIRWTPALAMQILDNNNDMNRSIRQARVEKYASDMRAGKWLMNGETIKFTKEGKLLDGQHRLWAVVLAEVPIDMLVIEGLDKEAMVTIDTGAARTFSDVASIRGLKNTNVVSAAARIMYWFTLPQRGSFTSASPTHSQLEQVLIDHPDLIEIARTPGPKGSHKIVPTGPLAFVRTVQRRINEQVSDEWTELLATGANMSTTHPVFLLRNRMINRPIKYRMPTEIILALTIKSWNMYITGKERQVLLFKETDPFPDFLNEQGKPFIVKPRKGR